MKPLRVVVIRKHNIIRQLGCVRYTVKQTSRLKRHWCCSVSGSHEAGSSQAITRLHLNTSPRRIARPRAGVATWIIDARKMHPLRIVALNSWLRPHIPCLKIGVFIRCNRSTSLLTPQLQYPLALSLWEFMRGMDSLCSV